MRDQKKHVLIAAVSCLVIVITLIYTSSQINWPFASPFTSKLDVLESSASSTTANAALGLQLTFRININSGDDVVLYENLTNTQDRSNNITASGNWVYPQYPTSLQCGNWDDYPIGYALLKGSYGLNNLTSARPLTLYNPAEPVSCATYTRQPLYYVFSPLSSNVSRAFGDGYTVEQFNLSRSTTFSGYYTGSQSSSVFHHFSGRYTLVGEDEWGDIILFHFTVVQA